MLKITNSIKSEFKALSTPDVEAYINWYDDVINTAFMRVINRDLLTLMIGDVISGWRSGFSPMAVGEFIIREVIENADSAEHGVKSVGCKSEITVSFLTRLGMGVTGDKSCWWSKYNVIPAHDELSIHPLDFMELCNARIRANREAGVGPDHHRYFGQYVADDNVITSADEVAIVNSFIDDIVTNIETWHKTLI